VERIRKVGRGELLNGTFITLRRLQWVGHVMRMKVERVTKKRTERIYRREKTSWKAHREMDNMRWTGMERGLLPTTATGWKPNCSK